MAFLLLFALDGFAFHPKVNRRHVKRVSLHVHQILAATPLVPDSVEQTMVNQGNRVKFST
jgi:hypothetical protein